jgi:hypothetical protein
MHVESFVTKQPSRKQKLYIKKQYNEEFINPKRSGIASAKCTEATHIQFLPIRPSSVRETINCKARVREKFLSQSQAVYFATHPNTSVGPIQYLNHQKRMKPSCHRFRCFETPDTKHCLCCLEDWQWCSWVSHFLCLETPGALTEQLMIKRFGHGEQITAANPVPCTLYYYIIYSDKIT